MSPKQKRFCQEYVIDLNGAQAAIRAGYSKKTARTQANQILTKLDIKSYIAELQNAREKETGISGFKIVRELARLAFVDLRKLYDDQGNLKPIQDLDNETAAALSGVDLEIYVKEGKPGIITTKKVRIHDKTRALEILTKHVDLKDLFKQSNNDTIVLNLAELSREQLEKIVDERLQTARRKNSG